MTQPPPVRRTRSYRIAGVALLIALIGLGILRSHWGTRLDSFTIDEGWHIVAGASYVRTGDWRLNPEHPPLVKLWVGASMPERLLRLRPLPVLEDKPQERDFVESTTYLDNDAVAVQQRARMAMWTFHGVLLLGLGLLAWRAFGLPAAAILLGVVALEPTLAANLPLVMTDLSLALTLGIAALTAGILSTRWRWRWVLATGLAMGLALASKHSALPGLAALGLGLALLGLWQARRSGARGLLRRTGQLASVALLAVAVLWASYGLRFHAAPDGSDPFNRPMAAKIADLNSPAWRTGIATADRFRLLPRPYLWGLADTVRAGVEGRGQNFHLLWGRMHEGSPPWHAWPSLIFIKLPLALVALMLLGAGLLVHDALRRRADAAGPPGRDRLPSATVPALALVLVAATGHAVALYGAQGTYAGIRHALPVLLALLTLMSLGLALAWQARRRGPVVAAAALAVALLATTINEPRLWEFHNQLAGGTSDAWRKFGNESMDLGQRFHEVRAFHDAVVLNDSLPLFGGRGRQSEGLGLRNRYWVESLDDDNVEGIFEGYFVTSMFAMLPVPQFDWDPDTFYADTEQVARMGFTQIRKGRVVDPRARARGIGARLFDYVYRENGDDWALVATRCTEILSVDRMAVPCWLELGNARLRLGEREAALAAYRGLLEQTAMPVDPRILAQVSDQVGRIEASSDGEPVAPLRNPWME